jgi:hypothetical protein
MSAIIKKKWDPEAQLARNVQVSCLNSVSAPKIENAVFYSAVWRLGANKRWCAAWL